MKTQYKVTRKTTESEITAEILFGGIKKDYRKDINTPMPFLNHMIEHIAWRSGSNIKVDVKLDKFDLTHVIAEDAGITIGKAVFGYVYENTDYGVGGYGYGVGIIDEAYAECAVSFESRANIFFDTDVKIPETVEGELSEDILTFLESFVQGANCTLHINVKKGVNAHHIWEAVYRAVGIALSNAFYVDEKRAGMTSGVAGKVEFITE